MVKTSPFNAGGAGLIPNQGAKISHASKVMLKILQARDFPGGPVVKTSPSSVRDAGLIPGQGAKNLHMSQLKQANNPQE